MCRHIFSCFHIGFCTHKHILDKKSRVKAKVLGLSWSILGYHAWAPFPICFGGDCSVSFTLSRKSTLHILFSQKKIWILISLKSNPHSGMDLRYSWLSVILMWFHPCFLEYFYILCPLKFSFTFISEGKVSLSLKNIKLLLNFKW